MAEEATVLNSDWLRTFIKDHVQEFRAELEKIRKRSSDGVPSVDELTGPSTRTIVTPSPLLIGVMGGGGSAEGGDIVGGTELNEKLAQGAETIAALLKRHDYLFQDLEDALEATIKELNETQAASLEQLTVDDFMDLFEDLDFNGGSGGSRGSNSD